MSYWFRLHISDQWFQTDQAGSGLLEWFYLMRWVLNIQAGSRLPGGSSWPGLDCEVDSGRSGQTGSSLSGFFGFRGGLSLHHRLIIDDLTGQAR